MSKNNATLGGRMLSLLFSIIGRMPFRLLYGIADIVAVIGGRVIGYRRKVVRGNLERCFPEMTPEERIDIERKFYHFLADYFVETMRLGVMSKKEIEQRMVFENFDELNETLKEGGSITLLLGHYCNWEWVSSMPLHMLQGSIGGQIYHPLESKASDYAFLKIRNHFGAVSIDMGDVLNQLLRWRRSGQVSIVGYIADQVPNYFSIHYFADFFGQETASFTGPERLAKMFRNKVYYLEMSRPRRGYYKGRFVKMSDDASKETPFGLTQKYYDLLEANIRQAPQYWLWSHRRWKRTREEFIKIFGEEEVARHLSRP